MSKTLLDYVQKEPEPTVICHMWKKEVPLKRCLETCISNQCLDVDQIVQLQKQRHE